MESKNSSLAILHEPFVAGMDENLSPIMQRLWKLEGGAIYFCRSGWAHVTIDLKDYEIVENTQIVLLPGTIIRINGNSSDFTASFFGFPKEMFREACLRRSSSGSSKKNRAIHSRMKAQEQSTG